MAFNGSGTFSRLYSWADDKAAGTKVRADRSDAELDGFATGLSTCITKDGQTTITADLPMNSHRFTGMSAGSSAGHSVRYEQVGLLAVTNAWTGLNSFSVAAPQISLTNGTSNWISWNTNGSGAPTFTTRSAGTKLLIGGNLGAASTDNAIGLEIGSMWFGVSTATDASFKWYGGTTLAATLSGLGALTLVAAANATAFNVTSDVRTKKDIASIAGKFEALHPVAFTRKADGSKGTGFIAQELYEVLPDAVIPGSGEPEDEDFVPWRYDVAAVVAHTVAEVQSLRADLAVTMTRITALENP